MPITMKLLTLAAVVTLVAAAPAPPAPPPPPSPEYQARLETWRRARAERLKADDGWLTLAGLFWLEEGTSHLGSDAGNDVVLPKGSAPPHLGVFILREGEVTVRPDPGTELRLRGKPVTTMALKTDTPGPADYLTLRDLTLFVIDRSARLGIRIRDKNSPARRDFKGIESYPANMAYRFTASFTEYNPPKTIPIPNVIGQTEEMPCPGVVTFKIGEKEYHLEPVLETPGAKELFFIFKDETSGKTTYPAGRFLYTALPKDGKVVLDFNYAYNPPCAFTPFATCPLPPKQNVLKAAIEAGEKDYGHH
jgi:hypothetical protein